MHILSHIFYLFIFETKQAQGPLHNRTQKYNPTQAADARPTKASQQISVSRFYLTYFYTYLELFPSVQSMKVHDLAKYEWSLFTKRK
jgi:hypothetical protein